MSSRAAGGLWDPQLELIRLAVRTDTIVPVDDVWASGKIRCRSSTHSGRRGRAADGRNARNEVEGGTLPWENWRCGALLPALSFPASGCAPRWLQWGQCRAKALATRAAGIQHRSRLRLILRGALSHGSHCLCQDRRRRGPKLPGLWDSSQGRFDTGEGVVNFEVASTSRKFGLGREPLESC